MPAAIGPRFVLEAGFLVLLAVVVGIADLDPLLIVLVMAVGWLLVSLIEYLAWRQGQGASLRRFEAAPVAAAEEGLVEEGPPPPPPPPAPEPAPARPAEEETVVAPAPEEPAAGESPPEPAPAEEPPAEPAPAEEAPAEQKTGFTAPPPERRVGHRLEPLQPRPRRRWVLFGPYEKRDAPPQDDREEER